MMILALRRSGEADILPFDIPWWISGPIFGLIVFLIFLTLGRILVGFARGITEKELEADEVPNSRKLARYIFRGLYTIVFLFALYLVYHLTGPESALITLGLIAIGAFVRSRTSE